MKIFCLDLRKLATKIINYEKKERRKANKERRKNA